MAQKVAMAIACHPDDIEFRMSGTLLCLQKIGWEIHYMNVSSGSLGSEKYDTETLKAIRREEAMNSCKLAGFTFHESITDDLEVFYNAELFGRLVPVIREVEPEIILTHGPYDYMEDHVNTGRIAVAAAFCRGMGNAKTCRPAPKFDDPLTVYHSLPHAGTDMLRRPVIPGIFVDVSDMMATKEKMLLCHKSQQSWLDVSQSHNSYIQMMYDSARQVGRMSKKYQYSEGWIRHNHLGFCDAEDDPLTSVLGLIGKAFVNEEFEESIKFKF